jgi:alkylation response protein AidB-like acyl-CoA dehydrogenase
VVAMLSLPFAEVREGERALREEVREFLREEKALYPDIFGFVGYDEAFSERLGKRGWLAMVVPKEYGGPGRSPVDQFIVAEELLAAHAPTGAHHAAERQTAPMLLRFGTEAQKQRFLPMIATGRIGFALGMSEPDSGSDLASVRTRATRTDTGWSLSGTKVWTSWADRVRYAVVLCRTSGGDADKHEGLSQLIVDLTAKGVGIHPITTIDGRSHFSEVAFDDVRIPDGDLLGVEGQGWRQISSELAYERGGPDRWLSTFRCFVALAHAAPDLGDEALSAVGRLGSWYRILHELSYAIARAVSDGAEPAVEAALVKDLGTSLEQEVVEISRRLCDVELDQSSSEPLISELANLLLIAPGLTIRGGTTEILRNIVAKELMK